jgi:hypothetical protein
MRLGTSFICKRRAGARLNFSIPNVNSPAAAVSSRTYRSKDRACSFSTVQEVCRAFFSRSLRFPLGSDWSAPRSNHSASSGQAARGHSRSAFKAIFLFLVTGLCIPVRKKFQPRSGKRFRSCSIQSSARCASYLSPNPSESAGPVAISSNGNALAAKSRTSAICASSVC